MRDNRATAHDGSEDIARAKVHKYVCRFLLRSHRRTTTRVLVCNTHNRAQYEWFLAAFHIETLTTRFQISTVQRITSRLRMPGMSSSPRGLQYTNRRA